MMMDRHFGADVTDIQLTPEQIAEIERRMSDEEPFATEEEVQSMFARLTG
jgi:hypothetical protein